jgi:DNA-binding SARP family transcriptional activator
MERARGLGLQVKLFGRFEVNTSEGPVSTKSWPRRKTQALLKVLLCERGRVFTQDQLIEYLFPDLIPDKAAENLHNRISELRRVLEPDLKQGSDSSYVLSVSKGGYCFSQDTPCSVDTEEFQKQLDAAQASDKSGRWLKALEGYQQAANLYRGDYLAEDLYEEWTIAPREEWRDRYLTVSTYGRMPRPLRTVCRSPRSLPKGDHAETHLRAPIARRCSITVWSVKQAKLPEPTWHVRKC